MIASQRHPAIFAAHGSPMHALASNDYTRALAALGSHAPRPRAILCVSAHWETHGKFVTHMANPRTIHDFHGFPRELREIEYGAPGCPALAERVRTILAEVELEDERWGLDHGAWTVLRHMFPEADVPVVQMSLDVSLSSQEHFALGRALRPLRDDGVLILGSGNVVHNLQFLGVPSEVPVAPWARSFDAWVKTQIEARDAASLVNLPTSREAQLSLPSLEHYWPLLYVLGASYDDEPVSFDHEGIEHGAVSMRCARFG